MPEMESGERLAGVVGSPAVHDINDKRTKIRSPVALAITTAHFLFSHHYEVVCTCHG